MQPQPKPAHLGPRYGAQFADISVVTAYDQRPPYPAELFALLTGLITATPRTVLDAGCGSGDLARPLAALVDRVDAVDPSAAMLARGRTRPGGDAANLRWLRGTIEDAPFQPPYALITAGESLHWMEWSVALPRFCEALGPTGTLAIVGRDTPDRPWAAAELRLIRRYTTNREFQPYDLLAELTARQLFRELGRNRTAPAPFHQSIDAYIESLHSRNGFSRARMTEAAADTFDAAIRAVITPFAQEGILHMSVVGTVIWGEPLPG